MALDRILNAATVAIVGASRSETKRGYQAVRTLVEGGFEGAVYPVNPKEESVNGLRCYRRVSEIDDPVDLVLITTPAPTVPEILEDCGRKGVAGAVIIAGGFGELGKEGRSLEDRLVEQARSLGIRLIGPNTSGMINVRKRLNLVGLQDVPEGDIALLAQSGNMALSLITEAAVKSRKGFSYYVGVGNEADIRFHEYLEFFQQDPGTRAILMYVEGMRDGRSFLQQAYRTTRTKPIILLKSGRTATGRRSAGTHTGALAGISEVARTAFKRAGIIVVENSDELFPAAESLSSLPPIRNDTVAILSDGGGHAVIAADLLTDQGVKIPSLSKKTRDRLREILPAGASVGNPVDIAGGADSDPAVIADCARILLQDGAIGGLLVAGLFGGYSIRFAKSLAFVEEDAAHRIGKLVSEVKKPVVVHSLYSYAKPHSLDLLRYYNIPVFDSIEIASRCVGVLAEYGDYVRSYQAKTDFVFKRGAKAKPGGRALIAKAREEGRSVLLEPEAKELLSLHGASVCPYSLARTAEEAAGIAAGLSGEVGLKIVSPHILHKTEAGGVRLNVRTQAEVRRAFSEIVSNARGYDSSADIRGVLVSPMVRGELEVIIGTGIDEQFGPVIMFGIGGIMVEVLKDVAFRVLPISARSAKMMIEDIKARSLINGFRGKPPVDKKAIARLLLTVSEIVESYPEIGEMDLNPVIVREEGLEIVDARIVLTSS